MIFLASLLNLIVLTRKSEVFMKNLKSNKMILVLAMATLAFTGLSCAKKQSKIRGAKTQQQVMNPQITNQSIQQADAQDLSYILKSVSTPNDNGNGTHTVSSELESRGNYIPIDTTHDLNQNSYGVFDDPSRGTKLDVRSRCIGSGCETYVLLVTIVKNGYAYHQMAAISFASDDFFYSEQRNYTVTTMYKNVDEVLAAHPELQAGSN